jgi:hypothetical protein
MGDQMKSLHNLPNIRIPYSTCHAQLNGESEVLYALDGLLFFIVKDYLSIGFHAFVLFFIFGGLKAGNQLNQIQSDPFSSSVEINKAMPAADDWLQGQEQRELRRQMIRDLKDPCPYCNFNLKSGKEQCEECGKLFCAPKPGA